GGGGGNPFAFGSYGQVANDHPGSPPLWWGQAGTKQERTASIGRHNSRAERSRLVGVRQKSVQIGVREDRIGTPREGSVDRMRHRDEPLPTGGVREPLAMRPGAVYLPPRLGDRPRASTEEPS